MKDISKSKLRWANNHTFRDRGISYVTVKCDHCRIWFDKELRYANRSNKHFCSLDCSSHGKKDRSGVKDDTERELLVELLGSEMALIAEVLKGAIKELKSKSIEIREDAEDFLFTDRLDVFFEYWGLCDIDIKSFRKLIKD